MRFRNLIRTGCAIALSLVIVPVIAQNLNAQSPDTTKISYGYGLESKKSVTGAVTTATPETFNQGAIFNPVDQLSGKVAGLTITEPGGDPNQNAQISIRGQSSFLGNLSPLFVVDGVILDDASEFQSIPPDEIVSYTVLKDASASAIYGVRGANGVVIVTTRKGATGKIRISYDGLVGAATQSKYYDLLNAPEYLNAISQMGINTNAYNKGANTDWQKAIGRTAIQDRNSLSVSGGSNIFTFLGAVDYQDQDGIIQNNGKEQLGLRFNFELKPLGDKLDVKAGIQNVNTTRNYIDYRNLGYVPNAPPTNPVKNPDGAY
ncbi:MAG: TonB-dependent receptor plug domain-containing protein [Bacteroidetes bacterium]|nr:TonB-dependent receptor plug domain-containing protein [Bacteroidota bacterium]